MVMRNDLDRFHLVMDVIDRVPGLGARAASLRQHMVDSRLRAQRLRAGVRRGPARDPRLDLAVVTPAPRMRVLVLNAGSATLKATVLDPPDRAPRFERTVDWSVLGEGTDRGRAIGAVLAAMADAGVPASSIGAVGYRVVHGGERFREAVLVDDEVVAAIDALSGARAAPQPHRRRNDPGRTYRARGRAARGRLRHRLPRHAARGGSTLPGARSLDRRARDPALRVPRAVGRLVGPARRRAARPPGRRSTAASSPISAAAAR